MTIEKSKDDNILKRLLHNQLITRSRRFSPLVLFNLIADPSFFAITMNTDSTGNQVLGPADLHSQQRLPSWPSCHRHDARHGGTGGQDISVGATIARPARRCSPCSAAAT